MLVVKETADTVVLLLDRESCRFRDGGGGTVELTADGTTGPLLAAARPDGGGAMWLGSWRRVALPLDPDRVELGARVLYSDCMCRRAAASSCGRVFRVHCLLGAPVSVAGREILVSGKGMPTYAVPARWARPRSANNRKRRNLQPCP